MADDFVDPSLKKRPSPNLLGLSPGDLLDRENEEDEEANEDNENPSQKSDEEILEEARARLKLAEEAESEIRRLALEDLEFSAGKQWPDQIEQERNRDGRPCLVINRLQQFIQQVTNDQRQNRPAIKVHPVGDGADQETAKVIQGLIRHIEYNSNAEAAYDTAFEGAVRSGLGYFRILTDFLSPDSFDQEILIKRVRNPLSIFYDPFSEEPDGSDADWAFQIDELSREDYLAAYPDSELSKPEADWNATGNEEPEWVKSSGVRIAEYFYKEYQKETIHLLSTGETLRDADVNSRLEEARRAGVDCQIVRSRKTEIPVIRWCKINGLEILEKTDWSGAFIPIIPVYGSELFINGKRVLESLIRHAKDPQRMHNYWKSAETEAIALAPRAPFIGAEGQFEGYEEQWKTANRRNHAYLTYKPTTIQGQMAPPPQRQAFEPAVQAISQAALMSADDMKATTGLYDPSLGNQSPDPSGIAIQRRNHQAQTANFHFVDNLNRSLKHAGRIIVDLIPKIYDTSRTARIIAEDGDQKIVRLNETFQDESGERAIYDLGTGRYDVTVDTGPSFASKRQEAASSMADVARSYPQIMGVAGDLFVKNMDWPGAQEIAERLKKTLPPNLVDDSKAPKLPPQVQAQMQHMGQMIENLTEHLNEATKVIETKKLDLEHRERVELMKIQAQLEMKAAELGSKEDITLMNSQIQALQHRLELLQTSQPIQAPEDFNPDGADGGNYAGIGHIGGTENLTGGAYPSSPGQPMEGT